MRWFAIALTAVLVVTIACGSDNIDGGQSGAASNDTAAATPTPPGTSPAPTQLVCDVSYYEDSLESVREAIDVTIADGNDLDALQRPYLDAADFYFTCADRMSDFDPALFEWTRKCVLGYLELIPGGDADTVTLSTGLEDAFILILRCSFDALRDGL